MKANSKAIAAVGLVGGAVLGLLASVPALLKKEDAPQLIKSEDFLTVSGRNIQNAQQKKIALRCISPSLDPQLSDMRTALKNRFGVYGQAQVLGAYEKSIVNEKDIDFIADNGFNCVRLSFSHTAIHPKGHIKGSDDFSRLDSIVKKCGERNIYIILNLYSATEFGEKEKQDKNYISFLKALAEHYNDNPAVAGFDITSDIARSLALGDKKKKFSKFVDSCIDSVRKTDTRHIVFLPGYFDINGLDYDSFTDRNCAVIYSGNGINGNITDVPGSVRLPDMPAFIVENRPKTTDFDSFTESGFTPMFGAYKAFNNTCSLYNCPAPDYQNDSYDSICALFNESSPVLNEELLTELKAAFGTNETKHTDTRGKKDGFHFSGGIRTGTKLYKFSK